MALRIVQVDPKTVRAVEGLNIDLPVLAFVGIDDDAIVGSGGLAWGGGRCWLWLSVLKSDRSYGVPIMRAMKRLVRKASQLGETQVFTPRDAQFETSERLLKVLGFELAEIENGQEIWACQVSN